MSILFVIVLNPYAHALKAFSLRRGKRLARHCAVKVCSGLRSVSSFGTGVKSVTSGPDLFDKGAFGTKSVRKREQDSCLPEKVGSHHRAYSD